MFEPTIKLAGLVIIGFGYSILAEYLGSSRLLGAFVAGVFFSTFENLRRQYEKQIAHQIQPVMSAVFFASIGFDIPLSQILEPVLFGWGVVYALIASFSKLATILAVPAKISIRKGGNRGEQSCGYLLEFSLDCRHSDGRTWRAGAADGPAGRDARYYGPDSDGHHSLVNRPGHSIWCRGIQHCYEV